MFLADCSDPAITLQPCKPFLAMDGTGTYGVQFRDVFVPDDLILADPAGPYVKKIRAGFVLLQAGMAIGLIRDCINLMNEVDAPLGHVNRYLPQQPVNFRDLLSELETEAMALMGPRQVDQAALFYEFSLERHVPAGHLLRSIDRFVDLSEVRGHLAPFYSSTSRPSIPSRTARPDAAGWLLLRHSFRAAVVRGSAPEPRLPPVLPAGLWTARCRTTRPSPRIGMAASAIAICCVSCSRPWFVAAWQKGWLMGRPLLSMPA